MLGFRDSASGVGIFRFLSYPLNLEPHQPHTCEPQLPSGSWYVPLLFSLLKKVSSLSSLRSDSNCMSGLASSIWASRKHSERSTEGSFLTANPCTSGPRDSPSRGLETGSAPCFAANRGCYRGDGSGGRSDLQGKQRSNWASQDHWNSQDPEEHHEP